MRKIKIGILLISNGFAGAENSVYELCKRLTKIKNFEIQLLINQEIYKHYNKLNIKIHNLGKVIFMNLPINSILANKKLRKILKNEKFDLVNSHMIGPLNFFNTLRKYKIPYLLTFHGSEINDFKKTPNLLYKIIIKPMRTKILNNSKLFTSVCSWQIQNLPERYKKKTVVITNGVDSNIFKPLKNIKQKKNVILFTGRFIELKGIHEILNVAKQLPQYEFWFAGQGPLANLINLPNTKNLGFKKTEELVKLYNQATICIQPSHREGFPLVGLEAMSCERAVIATPLGFSEYIENGKDGIIIPAKDEKALKEAIVDLMENPKKRNTLEKNARKKALNYSWDKIANQYLKVFKRIVKGRIIK